MVTAAAAIAPPTMIGVALTATSWWEGVTVTLGYLLSLGVLREWSLDGYPRRAILALVFTAAGWILGALTASSPISFVPLSLVGALLLARTRGWKLWMAVFTLGVVAIGATAFAVHPARPDLVAQYLVTPAVGTLFIAGVILVSEQAWQLVRRLERAREAEAELAVTRERVRFASDLHDIQGHSLHVIKLKAALAGRMVRTDPRLAEAELDDIRSLVDETIDQTRSLAYARHVLDFSRELENATRLCEAAGIDVEARIVEGTDAHPLLAQVLREATTNLLRHARPTFVSITASPGHLSVINDGVSPGVDYSLRGLANLRDRVERAGGVLQIEPTPSRFILIARIDPEGVGMTEEGSG